MAAKSHALPPVSGGKVAPWSWGSLVGSQSSSELSTSVGSGDMFGDKLGGRQVPDDGNDAGMGGTWRKGVWETAVLRGVPPSVAGSSGVSSKSSHSHEILRSSCASPGAWH